MDKLKPCPFCGQSDTRVEYFSNGNNGYWTVTCYTCEAEGPGANSPNYAAEKWNTRQGDKSNE